MSPRALRVPALALVGLLAIVGCSDDEGDGRVDPAIITAPEGFDPDDFAGAESFGLAVSKVEGCTDPTDDVGSSLVADTPPPIAQPHVDIVSTEARLHDNGDFTLQYVMGAPIRDDIGMEFLVQVGTLEDPNGFDLSVRQREGVWSLAQEPRTVGIGSRQVVRNARVTVTEETLDVTVLAASIPEFQPGQGMFFGVSGVMVDGSGAPIGRDGEPLADDADDIRAFDDCL